jgi:hypothetical protein
MAFIEISDLNAAGSDLFTGADSFLTELETTKTTQIFGGKKGGWNGGGKKHSGGWSGGGKKHSGGWNGGGKKHNGGWSGGGKEHSGGWHC